MPDAIAFVRLRRARLRHGLGRGAPAAEQPRQPPGRDREAGHVGDRPGQDDPRGSLPLQRPPRPRPAAAAGCGPAPPPHGRPHGAAAARAGEDDVVQRRHREEGRQHPDLQGDVSAYASPATSGARTGAATAAPSPTTTARAPTGTSAVRKVGAGPAPDRSPAGRQVAHQPHLGAQLDHSRGDEEQSGAGEDGAGDVLVQPLGEHRDEGDPGHRADHGTQDAQPTGPHQLAQVGRGGGPGGRRVGQDGGPPRRPGATALCGLARHRRGPPRPSRPAGRHLPRL